MLSMALICIKGSGNLNVIKQIIVSIYSPRDIASFYLQKLGKTILFLILLIFLSIIPGIFHLTKFGTHVLNESKQIVTEELPNFKIKNGVLTSNQKKPLFLTKHDIPVIFDSTGKITTHTVSVEGTAIGLLKNKIVFTFNGQTQEIPYSSLQNMVITNKEMKHTLNTVKDAMWVTVPIFAVLYYIIAFISTIIKILVLAIFAQLFSQINRHRLSYKQGFTLSAYAITLPTLFFFMMDWLNTNVPFSTIISWGISFIMLYLSIKELPKIKKDSIQS